MSTKHLLPLAIVTAIAFLFIYLANLSRPDAHIMRPVEFTDLTPEQQAQHQRALDAQKEMFQTLMGRLTAAMQEGGPTNAITVCSTDAKAIARQVSAQHTLSIGRTSSKLRNPDNAPPQWATGILESSPAPTTPQILASDQGTLALLNPIRIAPQCLQCHGSDTDIAPQAHAKLDELYPHDQATGYKANDLRGWFWIQVPPANQ
jgi:hypothetical protein